MSSSSICICGFICAEKSANRFRNCLESRVATALRVVTTCTHSVRRRANSYVDEKAAYISWPLFVRLPLT